MNGKSASVIVVLLICYVLGSVALGLLFGNEEEPASTSEQTDVVEVVDDELDENVPDEESATDEKPTYPTYPGHIATEDIACYTQYEGECYSLSFYEHAYQEGYYAAGGSVADPRYYMSVPDGCAGNCQAFYESLFMKGYQDGLAAQ